MTEQKKRNQRRGKGTAVKKADTRVTGRASGNGRAAAARGAAKKAEKKSRKPQKPRTALEILVAKNEELYYRDTANRITLTKAEWIDIYERVRHPDDSLLYAALPLSAPDDTRVSLDIEDIFVPSIVAELFKLPVETLSNIDRIKLEQYAKQDEDVRITNLRGLRGAWTRYISQLNPNEPNLMVEFGGKWYPVTASLVIRAGFLGDYGELSCAAMLVDKIKNYRVEFNGGLFSDPASGRNTALRLDECLALLGFRRPNPDELETHDRKLKKSQEMGRKPGTVVAGNGTAYFERSFGWFKFWVPYDLGTKERPTQLIIEHELETDPRKGQSPREQGVEWPMLRCYCAQRQMYVYIDVDDVEPYEFDRDATRYLVAPPEYKTTLAQIFDNAAEDLAADVVRGKHGGLAVLASGPPGVGKTMTAETFAECTGRPLYPLSLGDLGTDSHAIETNLSTIFSRAARWNALLLLDEADIILAKRSEHDLERSAVVGVFLRLLDYYQGFMFLTTNRPAVLDPAVLSRVTLHLRYDRLNAEARRNIWKNLLQKARLDVDGGEPAVATLAEIDLDGRAIRNLVRLAALMHRNGTCTVHDIRRLEALLSK